jgi:hypothetical protein
MYWRVGSEENAKQRTVCTGYCIRNKDGRGVGKGGELKVKQGGILEGKI